LISVLARVCEESKTEEFSIVSGLNGILLLDSKLGSRLISPKGLEDSPVSLMGLHLAFALSDEMPMTFTLCAEGPITREH
jgi:hypothetical protein